MPAEITWYIPNRVILVTYSDVIMAEDIQQSYLAIKEHIQEKSEVVHTIMDSTQVIRMGFTLKSIKDLFAGIEFNFHGWVLNVTPVDTLSSKANSFLIAIVNQSLGFRSRTFKTMPEAFQFLREVDETLVDALPE